VAALAAWIAAAAGFSPLVVGAVALATSAAVTGGLHLDGLMDAADGLFSGKGREEALGIMRDSRVGAMGAATLVVVVALKLSLLAEALALGRFSAVVLAPAWGRWSIVYAARAYPYARAGEGMGKAFARAPSVQLIVATALVVALSGAALGMSSITYAASAAASVAATAWAARRIGGMTGDLYGAVSEVAEVLALAAGIVAMRIGGS